MRAEIESLSPGWRRCRRTLLSGETIMSQKPRAAMKPADADPRPVAEPVDAIAESVTAAAEAAVEVMAVTAEAISNASTAAAETVTTISVGSAPAPAAIETTKPATKPGMEKKNTDNVAAFVAFSQGNLEALVKSGQNWGAGIQDLTQQIAATT